MPLIEINSTATNMWSTLVAATVGWLLATISGAIKQRADQNRRERQAAVAVVEELLLNEIIAGLWVKYLEREAELQAGHLLSGTLQPLETVSLEFSCLSGSFDQRRDRLGFRARNVLALVRHANEVRSSREMAKHSGGPTTVTVVQAIDANLLAMMTVVAAKITELKETIHAASLSPWQRIRGRKPPTVSDEIIEKTSSGVAGL